MTRTAAKIGSIEQVKDTLFAGNGDERPVLESKNVWTRRTEIQVLSIQKLPIRGRE